MTDPHTCVDPRVATRNLSSEHLIGYAFLSSKHLSLFRQLIDNRRSLPVYRSGRWLCYECPFESADLAATARHIVRAHGATPASEEGSDEDGSDLAY
jgi:hypothetical protein